jgi:DNA-binding transcriptional MerR regulator
MKYRQWSETDRVNIGTVSATFGIPASTLRYWESAGLIAIDRDAQNNYRGFSYDDLLIVSDLIDLHNLGISMKRMRDFPKMSLHEIERLYLEKDGALTNQIAKLTEILHKVRLTCRLIQKFNALQARDEICFSEPDVLQIIPHRNLYNNEVWQKYFSGQYQFGSVQFSETSEPLWGWITTLREDDAETLWEYRPDNRRFAECALRVTVDDRQDNNFRETRDRFHALGYRTGAVIARYVVTAVEGKRSDFYAGWIEIL